MKEGVLLGYSLYYVNFMFALLPGPVNAVLQQMRAGIKKGFYGEFCKKCAHHPRAPGERHRLPELILYPDLPVFKMNKKSQIPSVNVNGGFHYNGPIRIPPASRFQGNFIDHIEKNQSLYCQRGLNRINASPIDRNLADYTTKTLKRGWVGLDEIYLLPLSKSEMQARVTSLSPAERTIRDIQSSTNVSAELAAQIYQQQLEQGRPSRHTY